MADPAPEHGTPERLPDAAAAGEEPVSEVRYLPVPAAPRAPADASARPLARLGADPMPATIVAATGGFLAGVAGWVLVRVLRGRPRRRSLRLAGRRGRGNRMEVAGSRSFLVDVHLLKR